MRDLRILSNLTELTFLDLEKSGVSDLSPLASLTKLIKLNLSLCSGIRDFNVLSNLINLKHFELGYFNREKIPPAIRDQLNERGVRIQTQM